MKSVLWKAEMTLETTAAAVLRLRGVKPLLAAVASTSFAEFFLESVIYVWIVSITDEDPVLRSIALGSYVACSTMPRIIGAVLLGVSADRMGAGKALLVSVAGRLVVCASLLAVLGFLHSEVALLAALLGVVSIFSTLNQLFLAGRAQASQQLVEPGSRPRLSSVSMMILTGISILSAALGPALFERLGLASCLWVVFVLLFAAVTCTLLVAKQTMPPAAVAAAERKEAFFAQLVHGWKACWQVKALRLVLLGTVLYGIPMGINNVALIVLWTDVKQVTLSEYGIASALFGAGGLLGSLVVPLLLRRLATKLVYTLSLVILGASYLVLALADLVQLSFALMFSAGIAMSCFAVVQAPMLLDASPVQLTGRILATTNAATALSALIASLATATLAGMVHNSAQVYHYAVAIGGVLIILGGSTLFKAKLHPASISA